ncbi:TetR/AcrR family transcriptional regulator [Streptomyces sp. NPDC018026]|uniref:TetR/AcrR family transcriptional regulator n=1 Tax=Streptomyces sp. NPDC018026 TaxID=3365031 RepID=UPI0037B227DD
MRSIPEDRTTRALIRDEALALFAAHGPDSVTVRRIATAAGVSPGLVVHHFGSKDGLRQEVDQYVVAVFEAMLGELTGGDDGAEAARAFDSGAGAASLSAAFTRHLPAGSPLPGYLRRLLLSDTDAGRLLFGRLYEVSRAALDGLAAAGLAAPGRDPAVRAALLLANDLAVFLLRDRIGEVLGTDPLSADGMARWAPEVLDLYTGGLNASPPEAQEGPGDPHADRPRTRTARTTHSTGAARPNPRPPRP